MSKYVPQEKYAERQGAKGLTRVTVWVPTVEKDKLVKYAKKLVKNV